MAGFFVSAINTISNSKIKEITKLHLKKYRDETGLFIVEGLKAVEELINEKIEILNIYALKNTDISKINYPVIIIDENTIKKISTTNSPCEILAVAKQKKYPVEILKSKNKLILLDSISDPGNLGTIIRSSSAFGIEGIILYGNSTDLYSSKVVRSTAGNFFKVPVVEIKDLKTLKQLSKNYTLIGTTLSKENNINFEECKKLNKYIIMFGSESKGLSSDLSNLADKNIKLKMKNNVESLNLSISVSIILYELFN